MTIREEEIYSTISGIEIATGPLLSTGPLTDNAEEQYYIDLIKENDQYGKFFEALEEEKFPDVLGDYGKDLKLAFYKLMQNAVYSSNPHYAKLTDDMFKEAKKEFPEHFPLTPLEARRAVKEAKIYEDDLFAKYGINYKEESSPEEQKRFSEFEERRNLAYSISKGTYTPALKKEDKEEKGATYNINMKKAIKQIQNALKTIEDIELAQ